MPDTLTMDGFWAWVKQHPGAIARARLRDLAITAQRQAWTEWVRNNGPDAGLGLRFSPRAWDALGLTHRSAKYEKYKEKKFGGRNLPYTSPQPGRIHSRDMLKIRGVGYNFESTGAGTNVTTRITFPGMRVLNRIRKPYGETYRREFLQLTTRAAKQGSWVSQRSLDLFTAACLAEWESATTIRQPLDHFPGDN